MVVWEKEFLLVIYLCASSAEWEVFREGGRRSIRIALPTRTRQAYTRIFVTYHGMTQPLTLRGGM